TTSRRPRGRTTRRRMPARARLHNPRNQAGRLLMSISTDQALRARLGIASGALLSVILSGCASVQHDARFPEVRETVGQRLGANIAWNRNSEKDQRVHEAVRRLLQQELTAESAVQIALLNNRRLQAN